MRIDDHFSRDVDNEPLLELCAVSSTDDLILSFLELYLHAAIDAWPRPEVLQTGAPLKLLKWVEWSVEIPDVALDELTMSAVEASELEAMLVRHGWVAQSHDGAPLPEAAVFHARLLAMVTTGAHTQGLHFRRV